MRELSVRRFGQIKRRDGRRMLEMELPGKRKEERPKKRFLDVVKEDICFVGVIKKDVEDMMRWKQVTHCDDP